MGLPVKGEKKPRRREERTVFILTCGDKVAVRKRSEGSLLEGLYEFPGTFQHLTAAEAVSQAEAWGCRPVDLVRSARYKHVFTHVEWDMVGYYITCAAEGSGIAGETDRPKAAPELDAKGQPSGHGTAAKGQPSGHGAEEAGRQQAGFRWASSQEMEHEIPLPSAFGYFWNN